MVNPAHPLIGTVNSLIPLLNGAYESTETKKFLGPKLTKIHRYLITLYVAKHVQSFSLLGVMKNGILCFTLYRLSKIAETGFTQPIHYDRTKVAKRVYEKSQELGYVDIIKSQGESYVTTTDKGDKICQVVLDEFLQFTNLYDKNSNNDKFISKGISKNFDSLHIKRITYNILKTSINLNKQYGDEILSLEEEPFSC